MVPLCCSCMVGGLLILYGTCIIWTLLSLIGARRETWRVALLSAYLCITVVLSIWSISIGWVPGMVVIMFGPGALIAIRRLAYALFRIVQRRGEQPGKGSP